MKRILFTFPFLLLVFVSVSTLQAQAPHQRSRAVNAAAHAATYQQKATYKEAELNRLKLAYDGKVGAEKDAAKAQMLATLYELFDLAILKREAQADVLREQLRSISSNTAYQAQANEITQLKLKLAEVEAQIKQRKAYRDEIVARRLTELL